MKRSFSSWMALPLLPLLTACGSSESLPVTGTLSLEDFTIVSGEETLTRSASTITGTGTLIYPEPITDEAFHHELTFNLDDAGTLTWVAFAEAELANGIEVKFTRTGSSLGVTLLLNSASATTETTLSSEDASGALNYGIDAHNDESPAHLLIFPGSLTDAFTEANALFNSEEDAAAPGVGSGKFFGVKLENGTLTSVVGAAAKLAH